MRIMNRPHFKLLLTTLSALLVMAVVAPDAPADSEMKRSAGERKGNTLGASTSGRGSMRSSSRSGPVLPSEENKWEKEAEKRAKAAREAYEDDQEEDDDEPDFGSRSLGRVCMYGANGEVIFRPEGAWCRGDAPAARDESVEPAREVKKSRAKPSRREARRRDLHRPPPKRRRPRPRPVSECVWGPDGKVLHTPAGGFCRPGGPNGPTDSGS